MKYSNIGGQAVMEGVMMRNGEKYAVAVRTVDKEIVVKTDEYHSLIKNKKIQSLPIVRGVFNFVDSLVLGMKTLMYSADFFAEEAEEELSENSEDATLSENKPDAALSGTKAKTETSGTEPLEAIPEPQPDAAMRKLEKISSRFDVDFVISASLDKHELPERLQAFVSAAL